MANRVCEVQGCDRKHNARGYCFGHYERWKKFGHPDADRPLNTHVSPEASMQERINRRIDEGLTDNECWEWRGALGGRKANGIGYGKFTVRGVQYDAHRVSWELANRQEIPSDSHVLHRCDNPLCVNPKHLRLGSNDDNIADMVGKWRHTYGVRNPGARLDDDAVREIRASRLPKEALAEKFGVTVGTINGILAWRSWKHVD